MKSIIYKLSIIILLVFSFYYTNMMINFLKERDPIMKQIKNTTKKYSVKYKNAIIIDDNIISGKNGKTIDYNKSYNKMKKYGTYNETLTVLKEVTPKVSINNNYDKYIIKGNSENKNIALVFIINKDTNPSNILSILNNKSIKSTFFIDGTYLEDNIDMIRSMKHHELELLSYNNKYTSSYFKTSLYYLENLSGKKCKYCFTKYDNKELLNLCSKNKLHTVKPTLYLKNNIYSSIKKNISNSTIISFEINNYVESELSSSIDYIKSKGYNLVTLDTLISE